MKKAFLQALAVLGMCAPPVYLVAQSPAPQTYKLVAEAAGPDLKMAISIYRDGARERIEQTLNGSQMTTLFNFQTHTVCWINWFNSGRCSAGRYLSSRAPVSEDPITGTADFLAQCSANRKHKAVRTENVNGISTRLEEFEASAKPASAEVWPTRVWLAEPGDYLVKLEGIGQDGRPTVLFEIKQLSFERPPASLFETPANCPMTDSEMDESGEIRAHSETSVNVQGTGTADLGKDTMNSSVSVSSSTAKTQTPAANAQITAVILTAVEVPDSVPGRRKLQVTGTVKTDGPATIWYRFYANIGGVEFSGGQNGTATVTASGEVTITKDALFQTSNRGEMRLQAIVQTPGRRNSAVISNVVPFDVSFGVPGAAPQH